MEFGIGLLGEHPAHRMRALCQLIEGSGFEQIWVSDERFYRDVFVNMTVVACLTCKVKVGSMVTDPFVRHPAVTAAAAASVGLGPRQIQSRRACPGHSHPRDGLWRLR